MAIFGTPGLVTMFEMYDVCLLYTSFESFRNDGEITVFQVEEQFFERTPYLDPWMIPAHDAVNLLFVGYVFNDVAGMPQRKVYLVTLHGEDAAIALGQGVDLSLIHI